MQIGSASTSADFFFVWLELGSDLKEGNCRKSQSQVQLSKLCIIKPVITLKKKRGIEVMMEGEKIEMKAQVLKFGHM